MRDDHPSPAPDYRQACVVLFGVNITWILLAVWAIWGLVIVLMLALGLNHLMTRMQAWAVARADRQRRDPKPRAWWHAP
jgi:hypothetical protein